MGCNCGGRKKPSAAAQGMAVADADPRPHVWRVRFPNGATQDFQREWQANSARAVVGASGPESQPEKVYTD